jgi:hypothetical protein
VLVSFHKPDTGMRYRSRFVRADGLTIELDGGGYNKVGTGRVPHDLAHLLVEDTLGLDDGLWGVLARGGMFDHCTVLAGRRAPHAARRAQAVVDAAGPGLAYAELAVRAVSDVALAGDLGDLDALRRSSALFASVSVDVDAATLTSACLRLRDAAAEWDAIPPGGTLTASWPT